MHFLTPTICAFSIAPTTTSTPLRFEGPAAADRAIRVIDALIALLVALSNESGYSKREEVRGLIARVLVDRQHLRVDRLQLSSASAR